MRVLLVTTMLLVAAIMMVDVTAERREKPLLARLRKGVKNVVDRAKASVAGKDTAAAVEKKNLSKAKDMAKEANSMVTKVLSQAAAKAQAIIAKAKVTKCSKCKKKKTKAKTPEEMAKMKGKYLEVTLPGDKKHDYKKLGIHNRLNIRPRILHHAKWLNFALRTAHRNFVKVHEKNCKGPICPLGNGGIVRAQHVPGGVGP